MLRLVQSKSLPRNRSGTQTNKQKRLRVYLIEHNFLATQYLLQLLRADATLNPRFLADFIKDDLCGEPSPVCVIDRGGIYLPLTECLHALKKRCHSAKFVVLDQELPPDELAYMLSMGIHAFVPYSKALEQLTKAVACVAQDKMWIAAPVLELYVRRSISSSKGGLREKKITACESRVMELVKRRLSNREIGEILHVKESTVKFHLSNIFSKLQVSTRHQLYDENHLDAAWKEIIAC